MQVYDYSMVYWGLVTAKLSAEAKMVLVNYKAGLSLQWVLPGQLHW